VVVPQDIHLFESTIAPKLASLNWHNMLSDSSDVRPLLRLIHNAS
jgi:hypothetical protein